MVEEEEENENLLDKSVEHIDVKRNVILVRLEKFLENYFVVGFMSTITVYTLFFDDIRVLTLAMSEDGICYGITSFCFAAFMIEIILASTAREEYFLSFFFWLDLVSTLSMIPDIGWLWNLIIGQGNGASAGNTVQLAKTSRAGRVTRVIRIVRLIRLIRIVKLYKQAKLAQKKQEEDRKQREQQRSML